MAMRVLQPIYEKGNRGTKVVTQRSGGPWGTAARGNLYGRHGAGSYIRQPGYAVGPQRGRAGYSGSQGGRVYGSRINTPQQMAQLGYSSSYRSPMQRAMGFAGFRAYKPRTFRELIPRHERPFMSRRWMNKETGGPTVMLRGQ